ncbi:hypothetical protein H9Q73_000064 [Fusarium xylarioides]|nr:hypothetical protein H9Q73_000064 [Fusarium xylarioides]
MKKKVLDPLNFQEFPLIKKIVLSHNTAIYRFGLPTPNSILGLPIGQHISIAANLDVEDPKTGEVKNKEVVRSYTPISSDFDPGYFDLLVKTYPNGNISRHLATLKIGDTIKVKGPKGTIVYTPNMVRGFGMIAGGTGITPMLQIIKAIIRGRKGGDKTEVDLIFANVNPEDILLKEDIDKLATEDDKLRVYYVLNNPPETWDGGVGFVTPDMIKERFPAPASDIKILLCGPPPMVSAMKKATESLGYQKTRPDTENTIHHDSPSKIQISRSRPLKMSSSTTSILIMNRSYSTASEDMYTASFAFFEAIWDAGITHCFVNLGTDHPSIIEAMVKGQREKKGKFPKIITCPNEMVAMSMADGYARLTGKPQCVIVHVDVGTQGLGAAVHNASTGRAPVLVFAGLSPFTQEGEHRGSRTEYIHWIQDVPDQKQIISQYCRYTGEIKTGANVKQMVNRALQFATSDPQGPVYLCSAREILEADLKPYSLKQEHWESVELGGLPTSAVDRIAEALAGAKAPLLVTGYSGRNHKVPSALVELADKVKGLRVLDTGGCDMCFPADHPAWIGLKFGVDDAVESADTIVVLDCDVPWVQTRCKPREDAKIFHIDVDPLKQQMPTHYIQADARYKADGLTSIQQITEALNKKEFASKLEVNAAETEKQRAEVHENKLASIAKAAEPLADDTFGTGHLSKKLRDLCPEDTIWAIEAVTNTGFVHDNIQPTIPGSWINCGGGGLGWSGGGALGIKLATDAENGGTNKGKFVVQIVGDGTYLFTVPGSVYWISRRYKIPVLTIVLNNKGWNAPRRSLLLVHPDGLGSKATNEEINISFDPVPDYAGIAKAAAGGDIHAARVDKASDLESVLKEAIAKVQAGQTAVVDCKVAPDC